MPHIRGDNNNRLPALCILVRKFNLLALICVNILFVCVICVVHFQHVIEEPSKIILHLSSNLSRSLLQTRNAIDTIRDLLEAEYDQKDLLDFYSLVDIQLALGFRCAEANSTSQMNLTIVSSNDTTNNRTNNTIATIPTKAGSLSTTTTTNNYSHIIHRHRIRQNLYSFALNNSRDLCSDEPIDLLIMIISKSDNYKTRDAIRRTWGSGKNLDPYSFIRFKVLFLLDFDEKLENNIRLEQNLFRDIVQVELPPHYTLVTHRVLSLFEWSLRFCRSAKFVFKTDDDIFINIILLLKFLASLLDKSTDNSFRPSELKIYGFVQYHPDVFRDGNDPVLARYVVTSDEFPCENYPDHLSGYGYLVPKKTRDALIYAAYHDMNPFRISDVYITGILANYLSITRQSMVNYEISGSDDCDTFFNQAQSAYACASGQHFGDSSDIFIRFNKFWKLIRQV